MFDHFKTINESNTFEILENGYVLRVSGRTHSGDWKSQSFVFRDADEFFIAMHDLIKKESE